MKRAARESERRAAVKPLDGYWVAPTLRTLEAVRPRMKEHLKLHEGEFEVEGGEQGGLEPARQVAQLAEELQRFSATLASLLPALAEGGQEAAVEVAEPRGALLPAPPVPVSVKPHLPRRRKEFKSRIFRPGGVVEAPVPTALKARVSRSRLTYCCPACHSPTEIAAN
jgi:hypothetical protein